MTRTRPRVACGQLLPRGARLIHLPFRIEMDQHLDPREFAPQLGLEPDAACVLAFDHLARDRTRALLVAGIITGLAATGLLRGKLDLAAETLENLQLDTLDLYYLHAPDPSTPLDETLSAMKTLVEQKKIGAWGMSNFASWEFLEAMSIARRIGLPEPRIAQVIYNVLIRQLDIEWEVKRKDGSTFVCRMIAKTLDAWHERFQAHRAEFAERFDERFCRMWEFYLAASEGAFRWQDLMVFQIQIAKRNPATPLDRRRDGKCGANDPSGTLSFSFRLWALLAPNDDASASCADQRATVAISTSGCSAISHRSCGRPDSRHSRSRRSSTRARDSNAAFSSNDGFSVVAPTSTTVPSSITGRNESCCARVNR